MNISAVKLVLVAAICTQCVSGESNQRMHPPASERIPRVKRADEKFHIDGYESTSQYWRNEAQKRLRRQLEKKPNENIAKNVIMFLGDGMSISTITAARIYHGQKQGYTGEESVLSFEEFPHIGLSKVRLIRKRAQTLIDIQIHFRPTASINRLPIQPAQQRLTCVESKLTTRLSELTRRLGSMTARQVVRRGTKSAR